MEVPGSLLLFLLAAFTIPAKTAAEGYFVPGNLTKDIDCDIEYEHRMKMNLLESDCESEGHCWDSSAADKNCYRKKSDVCYLRDPADRIYLTSLDEPSDCPMVDACYDPEDGHPNCYMKKTDACYIPDINKREQILNADNEVDCLKADGCFIAYKNRTTECYMKEYECIITPENCEMEEVVSDCDADCGKGQQVEMWRCCPIGDESCPIGATGAVTVRVPRPCCKEPCLGDLDVVVDIDELDTTSLEETEMEPNAVGAQLAYYHNPNITKLFGNAVQAQRGDDAKEKLFWPCAQVDADRCKLNKFYDIERIHRVDSEGFVRHATRYLQTHLTEDSGQNKNL